MQYKLLPRFLQLEQTYACNSSCVFCYNPSHERQPDADLRRQIIDEVNSYEIDHVQLIGGEVSILPELPELLSALDQVRWRSIVTNGRIRRDDIVDCVEEVYLSMHGDKAFHEEITRAKNSYDGILANAEFYVASGIQVNSDSVLTNKNFHQVYDLCETASQIGMKSIFFNIFQPAGIGCGEDLSPSLNQIQDAITQLIDARDKLSIEVNFGTSTPFCLDSRLVTEGLAFTCGTGDWFASINPSGDLRICNQSTRPYGNILETPLHKIWQSREIDTEYRNLKWVDQPCKDCVFLKDCMGGCRIDGAGKARIDPIVKRDREFLLTKRELKPLKAIYENRSSGQAYASMH